MDTFLNLLKKLRYGSQFIALLLVFILSLVGYSYFMGTEAFESFRVWSESNLWRLVIFLVILKIVGVVWPPLPGVVPIIGVIPVVGWFNAFLIDTVGYLIGSTIAFYLSRRYGIGVIKRLFGQAGVDQVDRFKIRPERELEAIVLMKFFGGGIGEFISYAAGLTGMKLGNFFLGGVITSVVVSIPLFYYFNFAFSQNNLLLSLVPLGVGAVFFYFLRRRYFSSQE